jgi:hypothetical protein
MNDDLSQRGNVLIYALLTIAAVLSTTIVISNLIQNSIKETGFVSSAMSAYYAGESGLEKALFDIRKQDILPKNGDCGVSYACELTIDDQSTAELDLELKKDQTVQFDLFNFDDNSLSGKAESMGLSWLSNGSWLEVTTVAWDVGVAIDWQQPTVPFDKEDLNVQKYLYSSGTSINNALSANKNYRVRVKALYDDAQDLKIKLFNTDNLLGQQLAFPNFLNIKVVGSDRDSTQTIVAEMPRWSPLAGLFDYVIFSEVQLVK